jgi:hypothetical protein
MSKRRTPVKPADRHDEKPVKVTLSIPAEVAKRFAVHAAALGMSKSDLFADLVRQGCRRFVLSDRERGPGEPANEVDAA